MGMVAGGGEAPHEVMEQGRRGGEQLWHKGTTLVEGGRDVPIFVRLVTPSQNSVVIVRGIYVKTSKTGLDVQ